MAQDTTTLEEERASEESERQATEARMEKLTEDYFANKDGGEVETVEASPAAEETETATTTAQEKETDATGNVEAGTTALETDKEAETKPEDKKPEKAAEPPEPETDEFDKEIDSIKLKKGAHPNTEKALKVLKQKAKDEHRAAKEAKERAKALEDEKAGLKLLDEPTEKELNELRIFNRNFNIEHDPQFNEKYVKGLGDLEDQALAILKAAGLPDTTAEFIQKNGKALKFRSSQVLMPRGLKDAQGNLIAQHENGTPFTHQEFYEGHILPVLTPDQKEEMTAIGLEARNLSRKRDAEVGEAKSKGEQLLKDRAEQAQKQRETWQEEVKTAAEETVKGLGDVAKKRPIPANATAVEKALIDAKNAVIDRAQGVAQRYLQELSPKNLGKMAVIMAYHETAFKDLMNEKDALAKEKDATIADLEKKLNAIKDAGKTSNRSSAPVATEKPKQTSEIADPEQRMLAMMTERT